MTLQCNECNASFDSNFRLYQHKLKKHGPAVGLVLNKTQSGSVNSPGGQSSKVRRVDTSPPRSKRTLSDSDDYGNSPKRSKYESRLLKRKRTASSDIEIPPKRIRYEPQGIKRPRSSDDSHNIPKKTRKDRQDLKRNNVSSDDEPSDKRRRGDSDDSIPSSNRRKNFDRMKREILRWRNLYKDSNKKYNEFKVKCYEDMDALKEQIRELEELDGEIEMKTMTSQILNSVKIEEYDKISSLVESRQMDKLLRNRKYVDAIKKIMNGLVYGIIPVSAPQRVALNDSDRRMIKSLQNASVEDVQITLRDNQQAFYRIFGVIKDSMRLVSDMFKRYGI